MICALAIQQLQGYHLLLSLWFIIFHSIFTFSFISNFISTFLFIRHSLINAVVDHLMIFRVLSCPSNPENVATWKTSPLRGLCSFNKKMLTHPISLSLDLNNQKITYWTSFPRHPLYHGKLPSFILLFLHISFIYKWIHFIDIRVINVFQF